MRLPHHSRQHTCPLHPLAAWWHGVRLQYNLLDWSLSRTSLRCVHRHALGHCWMLFGDPFNNSSLPLFRAPVIVKVLPSSQWLMPPLRKEDKLIAACGTVHISLTSGPVIPCPAVSSCMSHPFTPILPHIAGLFFDRLDTPTHCNPHSPCFKPLLCLESNLGIPVHLPNPSDCYLFLCT